MRGVANTDFVLVEEGLKILRDLSGQDGFRQGQNEREECCKLHYVLFVYSIESTSVVQQING